MTRVKLLLTFTLSLYLAAISHAQGILLPKEIKAEKFQFITITAQTEGDLIRWYCVDKGISMLPPALLKDSKTVILIASQQGRFRLLAWTSVNGIPTEAAECVVLVGENPNPGPGPDPEPKPGPLSPLATKLKAALAKDAADPDTLNKLVAFYNEAVNVVKSGNFRTANDVMATLAKASQAMIPDRNKLSNLRGEISTYLNGVLPRDPNATVTEAVKAQFAREFEAIALALRSLN